MAELVGFPAAEEAWRPAGKRDNGQHGARGSEARKNLRGEPGERLVSRKMKKKKKPLFDRKKKKKKRRNKKAAKGDFQEPRDGEPAVSQYAYPKLKYDEVLSHGVAGCFRIK